jgi:glycine/D-amino acid oxidase-like deaminating enzyme
VDAYIKEHNVECEWTPRKTFDACLTHDFSEYSAKALDGVRKSGSTVEVKVLSGERAKDVSHQHPCAAVLPLIEQATRVDDVKNSYGWQAATLNPAQLTLSIHTENLSLGGYELFSWAPVHNVSEATRDRWEVHTPRGSVLADKVVFATNAYSQALVPELEGLITPMRGKSYTARFTDL